MKNKRIFFVALFGIVWLATACAGSKKNEMGAEYQIYYLDEKGNGLVPEAYHIKADEKDTVAVIDELFEQLHKSDHTNSNQPPIEAALEVSDFQIKETQLSVYFSAIYNNRSGLDEILCRAAIVKTLCQVEGVDYVEFYVEDQPLMISGNAVGLMNAASFVDNLDPEKMEQTKQATLYFADSTGQKLEEVPTEVAYNATEPIAQLLVEKLIDGPSKIKNKNVSDLLTTIPPETKLNSLTIRDNICYVDFSHEFMIFLPDISSDMVIYSIVNTLCELPNVTKVQFTIDGEQKEIYGDTLNFNTPFERDLGFIRSGSESQG